MKGCWGFVSIEHGFGYWDWLTMFAGGVWAWWWRWWEVVLLVVVVVLVLVLVPRIANGSFPSPPKFPKETRFLTS